MLVVVAPVVNGIECVGRPSLVTSYSTMCRTNSPLASIDKAAGCLANEYNQENLKTCTPVDKCAVRAFIVFMTKKKKGC